MRLSRLFWIVVLGAAAYAGFFWVPPGPRTPGSYDPAAVAALELEVFEAYDRGDEFGLFTSYVKLLRAQHKYSWVKAIDAGYHMAHASNTFRSVPSHFEQVLPDLERVYQIERDWMDAGFDPAVVAQAELEAWVGSRGQTPDVADAMTRSLATRDALRYNVSESTARGPASLYAQAALMRDRDDTDWPTVATLLADAARAIAVSVRVH